MYEHKYHKTSMHNFAVPKWFCAMHSSFFVVVRLLGAIQKNFVPDCIDEALVTRICMHMRERKKN